MLSARFDDNLLDATNAWALYVTDRSELAGVPDPVLADAEAAARAEGKAGWKLTLHMPCYLPVMSYADNRALRAALHRAYATRASDLGAAAQWDNGPGHRAHSRAAPRGRAAARIPALCRALARSQDGEERRRGARVPARSRAPRRAVRRARLRGAPGVRPNRARPRRVSPRGTSRTRRRSSRRSDSRSPNRRSAAISPKHRCSPGSSAWPRRSTASRSARAGAPTWHADVRFFDVVDAAGALIGQFYLDNYARPGKQGGAWQDDAINRRRTGAQVQHPVSFLTCNLSAPSEAIPRRSRTTKSSRCSTNSATACTSC